MSKRDFFGDDDDASKMRMDESDDGGGSGRRGRVRKKSAKVLEMEEFEQAEKSSTSTKKSKTPKVANVGSDGDVSDGVVSSKKSKTVTSGVVSSLESTPTSRKIKKTTEAASSLGGVRSVPAELTRRAPSTMVIAPMATVPQIPVQQEIKPVVSPQPSSLLSSVLSAAPVITQEIKQDDPKSVIKYLLTSPSAGTPHPIATQSIVVETPSQETPPPAAKPKKSSKKIKFEDGTSAPPPKKKKMKIEIMSPSEIKPPAASIPPPSEPKAPSLKMKIVSGSNPMTAQVAMETQDSGASSAPKVKKSAKKIKKDINEDKSELTPSASPAGDGENAAKKKKKVSKKKEKLIQNAISAAKQMPNLAALVSTPQAQMVALGDSPSPITAKPSKKKMKQSSSPTTKTELNTSDSLVMDFDESGNEDEGEESTLVIAETEKKKKKVSVKKKSPKEKDGSDAAKAEKAKKIPKRAPTAYMLFCNSHRPAIVAENPGIEFAGISRKLGELWQTQSNKQKLQWRRKAQRRLKKSNLISTGKVGGKESQGGPLTSTPMAVAPPLSSTNKKLALMLQRSKPPVMVVEEGGGGGGPLSPTKVGIDPVTMEHDENDDSYNFSIEPLDVAAHLKLLGESLSIIGMRLQEHKGMIAVQGSLSVLLDSLLCACGPLLCLTQQVPGMDGCSPMVHAQTLDSVAYVMPGL